MSSYQHVSADWAPAYNWCCLVKSPPYGAGGENSWRRSMWWSIFITIIAIHTRKRSRPGRPRGTGAYSIQDPEKTVAQPSSMYIPGSFRRYVAYIFMAKACEAVCVCVCVRPGRRRTPLPPWLADDANEQKEETQKRRARAAKDEIRVEEETKKKYKIMTGTLMLRCPESPSRRLFRVSQNYRRAFYDPGRKRGCRCRRRRLPTRHRGEESSARREAPRRSWW